MPGGVFKPYAGVSTAIVLFTKTNSGGTEHVWFYDMQADGKSLDDKRNRVVTTGEARPSADGEADGDEHAKNNLPDILQRWEKRDGAERKNERTVRAFACRSRTSSSKVTTCRSTVTRKSSTKKSTIAHRKRFWMS